MSRIKQKFIRFGTGTDDTNAQLIPANYTATNYTPAQVASEGTDKVSAHLKGINNALGSIVPPTITAVSSNITLAGSNIYLVNTSAARSLTLPSSPTTGTQIILKDVTGSVNVNNITIVRAASETIEGVAASYVIDMIHQSVTLISDASGNWWLF